MHPAALQHPRSGGEAKPQLLAGKPQSHHGTTEGTGWLPEPYSIHPLAPRHVFPSLFSG